MTLPTTTDLDIHPRAFDIPVDTETVDFDAEWKALDGETDVVEGYASVFGNVDGHRDVVAKGAFTKSIKERVNAKMVLLLDSHNASTSGVIGSVISAKEDPRGLRIRARLSSTANAQEIKTKMLEGHLSKFSIGYLPVRFRFDTVETKGGPVEVRILEEVKLFEVSVVAIPANELAVITSVKSALAQVTDLDWSDKGRAALQSSLHIFSKALRVPEPIIPQEGRFEAKARNIGEWLESRIHALFTNIADDMFGGGYLTRDERISLSSAIGAALDAFRATVESDAAGLYDRDIWEGPPEEKALYGSLEGSVEARQQLLSGALKEAFGADGVYVWIVATYPDRVVYSRSSQDAAEEFFEVSYTIDDDQVTFGDPTEVEITSTVQAKTAEAPPAPAEGFDLAEWKRRTESLLAGTDPDLTADPVAVAGDDMRLQLLERDFGIGG